MTSDIVKEHCVVFHPEKVQKVIFLKRPQNCTDLCKKGIFQCQSRSNSNTEHTAINLRLVAYLGFFT